MNKNLLSLAIEFFQFFYSLYFYYCKHFKIKFSPCLKNLYAFGLFLSIPKAVWCAKNNDSIIKNTRKGTGGKDKVRARASFHISVPATVLGKKKKYTKFLEMKKCHLVELIK